MASRVEHLKSFHEILRATLTRAMREPGAIGEAARKLAAIAEAHFHREEELVAPLLALLPALASGDASGRMAEAPKLARALRQALEPMCEEHRRMAEALRELARLGLSARMEGIGVVVEQTPPAGSPLEPGATCTLVLNRVLPRTTGVIGDQR